MKKKIVSLVVAFAMAFALIPATALSAYATTPDYGYTTDEHQLMAYKANAKEGYDFEGYVQGAWRQVTYSYRGFAARVYQDADHSGKENLEITAVPTFVADGRAIQVDYTVKNTGTTEVGGIRFYTAADTMIAGNDNSTNTILSSSTVLMSNTTDFSTPISLFAFSPTAGGIPVTTNYRNATVSYVSVVDYGADPSTVTSVSTSSDSAIVTYYPVEAYAPGQERTYTLVIGMGDQDEIDEIINEIKKLKINASVDYPDETLENLLPDIVHEITVEGDDTSTTYKFSGPENGTIPLAGTDENGVAYDFIGKTINITAKGDGDRTLDSDPQTIVVAPRPEPTITTTPKMHSIVVDAQDGYEYSIDGGQTWLSEADDDGNIVFDNLDAYTEYTITYKILATETAPKSLNKEEVVKTLCDHADTTEWEITDDKHKKNCIICGQEIDEDHMDEDTDHYCDVCNKKLSEHNYGTDWTSDDDKHWHECDYCGAKKDEAAHADVTTKDHKCDTCQKVLSECEDADSDHYCDWCGKRLTTCTADEEWSTDNDKHWHLCTICGAKMNEAAHADANKDHYCDTCNKKLSECADDNNDHKCDYCGAVLTVCVDENNDHKCDICGITLSECGVDVDPADHKCDICGKVVSVCKDDDKDHYCDICSKKLSDCTPGSEWLEDDTNHWHLCTYCGGIVSLAEHYDNNKDHKCDVCGKVLSVCEDENTDHYCDYCNKKLSNHSGGVATCQDKAVCDYCGQEYGKVDRNNHAGLTRVDAKKATVNKKGNIKYWYCKYCDRYFTDADATNEITKADTIIPKLTADDSSESDTPRTGDGANMMLLFVLLLAGGGAVAVVARRKKKFDR